MAVHALAERELIAGDVVAAIRLLRAHQARVQEALGCTPCFKHAHLPSEGSQPSTERLKGSRPTGPVAEART